MSRSFRHFVRTLWSLSIPGKNGIRPKAVRTYWDRAHRFDVKWRTYSSLGSAWGKFVQTTFSLPAEEQGELLRIAEDSHVSTAWVVWEAVRLYLLRSASTFAGTYRYGT